MRYNIAAGPTRLQLPLVRLTRASLVSDLRRRHCAPGTDLWRRTISRRHRIGSCLAQVKRDTSPDDETFLNELNEILKELSPEGQAQGVNATWLETIREQGLQLVSKLEKMQQEAQASRVELLKVQRLRVKENQQLKVMQEALTQAIQNLTALEARAQTAEALKEKMAEQTRALEELQDSIGRAQQMKLAELEANETRVLELEDAVSKLEERLADQTSIASEVSLLKAELEAVRAEEKAKEEEAGRLKEELEKARAGEEALMKELESSSSERSELSAAQLERLKEDLETAEKLLADKQDSLVKLDEEVTLLRAKAAEYETQVAALQAKTTELENTVAELHGLLAQSGDAGLNAQYQEARRMVSALQQDIFFLQEKEAQASMEAADVRQRMREWEKNQKEEEELRKKEGGSVEELRGRVLSLEASLADRDAQVKKLEEELAASQQEVLRLQQQQQKLEEELVSLKELADSQKVQLEEIVLLRQNVEGREAETAEMAGKLVALQAQTEELTSLLKAKEAEVDTANTVVATLKEDLSTAGSRQKEVGDELEASRDELEASRAEVLSKSEELAKLQKEMEELNQVVTARSEDLKRFRVEVAAVVEADKEKAEALTALMQQLNAARASETGLKKELDAATQTLQAKSAELADLQGALEQKGAELAKLQKETTNLKQVAQQALSQADKATDMLRKAEIEAQKEKGQQLLDAEAKAAAELQVLKAELSSKEEQLQKLQGSRSTLETELSSLRLQVSDLLASKKNAEQQASASAERALKLEQLANAAAQQGEAAQQLLEKAQAQLFSLESQLEDQRREKAELLAEMSALSASKVSNPIEPEAIFEKLESTRKQLTEEVNRKLAADERALAAEAEVSSLRRTLADLYDQGKYTKAKEAMVSNKVVKELAAAKAEAKAASAEAVTLKERVASLEAALLEARSQTSLPLNLSTLWKSDAKLKAALDKMEELQRENAELKQAQERRRSVLSQSNKFLGSYLENMKPLLGDLTTDDESDEDVSSTGRDSQEDPPAASPQGEVSGGPVLPGPERTDRNVQGLLSSSEYNVTGLSEPPALPSREEEPPRAPRAQFSSAPPMVPESLKTSILSESPALRA